MAAAPTTTPISTPLSGRSVVKNVVSADTVVLRGKPAGGPPPEYVFSLAHISAPRLGTSREPEKEEPFAFEAREYLRRLVVGKEVAFKTDYTTTSNNRSFGSLLLRVPVNGEANVSKLLVRDGWAKVRMPDGKRQPTSEQLELADLETEAQEAKRGIWADGYSPRQAFYNYTGQTCTLLENLKGTPIPAVLEQVRDGSTLRVLLVLPKDGQSIYQHITLSLSGIKAPTLRKDVPNMQDLVEPFAEEAKYFVESRLLQKDIHVVLESISGTGKLTSFSGSIQFPAGNISEALLAEGLAKVVEWNLSSLSGPGQVAAYKLAEETAKSKRVRMWHGFIKPASDHRSKAGSLGTEYEATVLRILGADLVVVEPISTPGKERKLQLASVRGPKRSKNESGFEVGYSHDAQELLRSRLVGHKVHVRIDYVKPAEGEYEQRDCATLTVGNNHNISEVLVSRGLATVVRHRKDDNSRSAAYDNAAKSRQYLPFFQRSSRVQGIVEYVSSGSRLRISVPAQSCRLVMVLGGIRTPKTARNPNEKSEPYGPESTEFVSRLVLQHEVELEFDGVDKVGGFIGSVFIKPISGTNTANGEAATRINLAVALLEYGFATIHDYSASQSQYSNQLYDAETRSKEARRNIWTDYDPTTELADMEEADTGDGFMDSASMPPLSVSATTSANGTSSPSTQAKSLEMREIIVSNITADTGLLHIQLHGAELTKLEHLMGEFSHYHSTAGQKALAPFTPRAGDYCSAQFTVDKCWYRARVRKLDGANSYTVVYIDYGNSETVPGSRLRVLPAEFSVAVLKPQAVEAQLAYVVFPGTVSGSTAGANLAANATSASMNGAEGAEFSADAFAMLRDLTEDRRLAAQVVGRTVVPSAFGAKSGTFVLNLVIYDLGAVIKETGSKQRVQSLNETMVREGLVYVGHDWSRKYEAECRAKVKALGASFSGLNVGRAAGGGDADGAHTTPSSTLESIVLAQDAAKAERLNLWQYGDFLADAEI
ncbi:hypothetical protein BSLG_008450 [Batrachochytrium salamandrivorans]|nr:hypothetical protein BSLG_008450 [Batrachochytrium salamandrivorans]